MLLRIAIMIVLMASMGCNSNHEPAPAGETSQSHKMAPSDADGDVTGKVAPSVAPPSAFVALEAGEGLDIPVKAEPAIMDQVSLVFYPSFLIAQTGQTVEFQNGEDVLHNIRVTEVAGQNPIFNVATPPFGKYQHKFERAGMYTVGCDIHSTMRADILITTTPYTAVTGKDGSFTFSKVKAGTYRLTVYAGPTPTVRSIEVKPGTTDLGMIQ